MVTTQDRKRDISAAIVAVAEGYLGQTEKPGNSGFLDPILERDMAIVGWQNKHAWCAYFCELVLRGGLAQVGEYELVEQVRKHFSASATQTFRNFSALPGWEDDKTPQPGDVVIWQYGKGWQGHAGIVVEVQKNGWFRTVEGNGNDQGGREGLRVVRGRRLVGQAFRPKGLNLMGFFRPKL